MSKCVSLSTLGGILYGNSKILNDCEVVTVKETRKGNDWFYTFTMRFPNGEETTLEIPTLEK